MLKGASNEFVQFRPMWETPWCKRDCAKGSGERLTNPLQSFGGAHGFLPLVMNDDEFHTARSFISAARLKVRYQAGGVMSKVTERNLYSFLPCES